MKRTDALEVEAIRAALPPPVARSIGALECVADIDSTNAELLRRAASQPDVSVLIADAQSAGRGRRGRPWHSPPGANLYLSLYWRHGRDPAALGGLSLVVGTACAEALRALGYAEVGLKWPNDLLARGRKLGGVLIELAPGAAVIGLGLNVLMPEDAAAQIDQAWIDLATLGSPPSRSTLVVALLRHLMPALDEFAAAGLTPFLPRWQALDALAGAWVLALAGEERLEGEALGLAPDGGLRLRLVDGERVLHSADVSVRAGSPNGAEVGNRESLRAGSPNGAEVGNRESLRAGSPNGAEVGNRERRRPA